VVALDEGVEGGALHLADGILGSGAVHDAVVLEGTLVVKDGQRVAAGIPAAEAEEVSAFPLGGHHPLRLLRGDVPMEGPLPPNNPPANELVRRIAEEVVDPIQNSSFIQRTKPVQHSSKILDGDLVLFLFCGDNLAQALELEIARIFG